MIDIEIDNKSGFCFGVVNAISKAEEELAKGETLYCLGDIVHNGQELTRLEKLGLVIINHEQFSELQNVKVLLRAHGEPPGTYETARQNNIEIIDASCPVVLRLQSRIKTAHNENPTAQIVIFGKKGHAEVNGLVGQTNEKAIVIEDINDLHKIDLTKDIYLFSQTTKSLDGFNSLVETVKKKMLGGAKFYYFDTICRQVANRIPNIVKFAKEKDVIIFVSGKKSSNGKELFECCKKVNKNSFFLSKPSEIENIGIDFDKHIGICGATSTPRWLMEEVKERISRMEN